MTRLIARLILAMLLPLISGTLLLILLFSCSGSNGPTVPVVLVAWFAVYGFIAVYWVLLWRGVVRWTGRRILGTVSSGLGAIAAGGTVSSLMLGLPGKGIPVVPAMLFGGGVVPIIWVLATVCIWRETPQERMDRLNAAGAGALCCPMCGYNLTGLREARCPECGSAMTLEELVASQPRRDAVTLPHD